MLQLSYMLITALAGASSYVLVAIVLREPVDGAWELSQGNNLVAAAVSGAVILLVALWLFGRRRV
jgi:uncharacterized protein (TIGR03382 family)